MGYLKGFPQLKLRYNVIYANERNGDELSPFINGDRLIDRLIDIKHKSDEHFYRYELCLHCDGPDIAKQVYDAPSPKAAKHITNKV